MILPLYFTSRQLYWDYQRLLKIGLVSCFSRWLNNNRLTELPDGLLDAATQLQLLYVYITTGALSDSSPYSFCHHLDAIAVHCSRAKEPTSCFFDIFCYIPENIQRGYILGLWE